MKVYTIIDGSCENIIRLIVSSKELAEQICNGFPHENLHVEEFEVIGNLDKIYE